MPATQGIGSVTAADAIVWDGNVLQLLDQRVLPGTTTYLSLHDAPAVREAIADMVVRGAPAIGIAAAYGVAMSVKQHYRDGDATWVERVRAEMDALGTARPTAVNLAWALARLRPLVDASTAAPVETIREDAERIHAEDIAANETMGKLGAGVIESRCGLMTHCNAGALATGGYGTALGVVRSAFAADKVERVLAGETRPWLQGARLTAWELTRDGIPVDVISDSAASYAMRQGRIGWVVVGADRVARNGDVANKIGTYSLAVNARHHGVKFMVVAPSSTVDLAIPNGDAIPIEERAGTEVLEMDGRRVAADGAGAWNPVFDVTPAALVDVIVTERGVIHQPDEAKVVALLGE